MAVAAGDLQRPTDRTRVVLVVEDDPVIQDLLHTTLTGAGHVVVTVAKGVEAIAVLSARRIDAVIVEPSLPGPGGAELVAGIRRTRPQVPILLVTTDRLSVWFADLALDEIQDHVSKPIDRRELLDSVERTTRKPHAG